MNERRQISKQSETTKFHWIDWIEQKWSHKKKKKKKKNEKWPVYRRVKSDGQMREQKLAMGRSTCTRFGVES